MRYKWLLIWLLLVILVMPVWAQAETNVALPMGTAEAASKINVSLHFKEVEVRSALLQLAKEADLNIVGGEDLSGRVTISLTNVPLSQALAALLSNSGYTYELIGDRILKIVPSQAPARRIDMGNGMYLEVFSINYANPDNVSDSLASLTPQGGQLYVPKGSNKLFVKGKMADLNAIRKLLKVLDRPPRQVMVEARILEVTSTTSNTLGSQPGYISPTNPNNYVQTVGLAGKPTDTGAQGLFFGVSTHNVTELLEAFRSDTNYNIVSSPRVLAVDGQSAEIITGSRLGYRVKTFTPSGMMESVEFMDVGTKLTIKPTIKDDNTIFMQIHPEISTGSVVLDLPKKDSTETTTTLSVKSGQTIVIGGLTRDYLQEVHTGVPILMDIPWMGTLFRRTVTDTQKREIIILINPVIIDVNQIEQQDKEYKALDSMRKGAKDFRQIDLMK